MLLPVTYKSRILSLTINNFFLLFLFSVIVSFSPLLYFASLFTHPPLFSTLLSSPLSYFIFASVSCLSPSSLLFMFSGFFTFPKLFFPFLTSSAFHPLFLVSFLLFFASSFHFLISSFSLFNCPSISSLSPSSLFFTLSRHVLAAANTGLLIYLP